MFPFILSLTAQEVEERLNSISNKLDKDVIRQSLANPSSTTVPSTQAMTDVLGPLSEGIEGLGSLAGKDSVALDTSEVTGVLPISKGGTGALSLEQAQQNLGILSEEDITTLIESVIPEIGDVQLDSAQTSGVLPISKGGSGAQTTRQARINLGVWSASQSETVRDNVNESLRRSYTEAGYNVVGTFREGFNIVNSNDVGIDERTGKAFTGPAGPVNAGTNPTSGGFIDVSGVVYGDATVAKINSGMYEVGAVLTVSDRAGATFLITAGDTPNGTYILDAGGNTAVYQIPSDGVVNVKALGGKSGVDSSLAVQHACALSTKVHFPDDDVYEISYDVNNGNRSFVTYSNESFIRITGDAATIKDVSTFNAGTSYLVDIFKFVACTDVYINVNCDATPLPDLTAPSPEGLGYKGSSFVYFEDLCSRVTVDGYHKNVRYGVRSGNYSNPAFGGLNDIKVRVKCFQVGYPVALYLAKNIKLDIDSNNQHRAAYLAGCQNVSGRVTQAGFMYAHIGVLVNDSLTTSAVADADRRSYGCDNIHLNVFDRGTTGTQSNRAVCGINAQWKAPDIAFNDVHFHIYAYCNNANRTLAGFRLENTVGWMSTNEYNNIKVSGLIDRRAQTLGASSYGDFSIDGIESGETGSYPNSPKFNGIDLSELQIINAAVTGNLSRIMAPNAVGVINLRGAKMAGASISTNAPNARIVLTNASVASVTGPGVKFPTKSLGPSGYRVGDDGIIEQWMQVNYTATANTDQTFTFPTAFPNQAFAPSVTSNGFSSITATVNGVPTQTSVTVRCNTTGTTLFIRVSGY